MIARLLAVAALLSLCFSGCGPTGKQVGIDVAQCALGQVPSAVAGAIPDVTTALTGTAVDWTDEIARLEASGVDFAICAVEAAVHDLTSTKAALSPKGAIAIDRATVYLAGKKAPTAWIDRRVAELRKARL